MENQLNFIKPYLRGWIIIVMAMTGAYLLASKYLSYVTPMYESTAKLRLADLNEGVSNSNLFKDLDVFANTQKINAEIELIKSHTIIKKALTKVPFETTISRHGKLKSTELLSDAPLKISKIAIESGFLNKPFQILLRDTSNATIVAPDGTSHEIKMNDTIRIAHSSFLISINAYLISEKPNTKVADHYTFEFTGQENLISEILKNLDVTAVDKDVPVIRISYKSAHPEKAALFPNALAQAYIEDYVQTKFGAADVTSDFLNGRINEIGSKLAGTESAILNYREKEDITNIRQETETDLRKISQLKIQQTNLKMSLDAIRELDQYIEKGKDNFLDLAPNFEAFTDLLSTEMIKKIKQLQSDKKDLLLQYTPKDEKVITIDRKIEDISSYLKESIRNTRKNLESKYNNLVYDIEEAEKVFITVPEKERMMTILNREFEIYQQSYNFLNQKKIEAEIAKAAKVAFHRIITPASISKMHVSPNRTIIKGVAVILGMLGAMMLIFIVHSMKARVNDISSVESNSMIPVIASVPKLKKAEEKANFFLTTLTQWQVKGLLQTNGIISFTGYNQKHAADFVTSEVIKTFQNQGRKLLLVKLVKNIVNHDFWTLNNTNEYTAELSLDQSKMMYRTTEEIQSVIKKESKNFDQTIILNSNLGETFTLAIMAISDLNVVCIDTRLTPAKKVIEMDLLAAEYKLPNVYFAINRVGYNPSFVFELIRTVRNVILAAKNIFKR